MKPKILISKCLCGFNCRYDGTNVKFSFINSINETFDLIKICPEVEIGLGVPRDTLKLVETNGEIHMIQPKTGNNYTERMEKSSENIVSSLRKIDGIILKSKSPSCGVNDTKIYGSIEKSPVLYKGSGIFSEKLLNEFPNVPVEVDGRMNNLVIREHFYTRVFLFKEFKEIKVKLDIKDLIKFHSKNKYLYFSYSQKLKTDLGKIVASYNKKNIVSVYDEYEKKIYELFSAMPIREKFVNSFFHIFGYMKNDLSKKEKEYILDNLEDYSNGKIQSSVIKALLRSYSIRFNKEYLLDQTIFESFPKELNVLIDSAKG